jgi:hypothetical protein
MTTPTLVLDFTQPAASVLLAQINHDNSKTVTPDQIRFGQVAALPLDDPSGLNSMVYVAALQGASFEGQEFIRYNRIDISTVPGGRSTQFILGGAIYVSDLLSQINEALSLNLQMVDIVDTALPVPPAGESAGFTLQIAADALLWHGSVLMSVMN